MCLSPQRLQPWGGWDVRCPGRETPAPAPTLALQGLPPLPSPQAQKQDRAWSPVPVINSPAGCGLGDPPTPSHPCLGLTTPTKLAG